MIFLHLCSFYIFFCYVFFHAQNAFRIDYYKNISRFQVVFRIAVYICIKNGARSAGPAGGVGLDEYKPLKR